MEIITITKWVYPLDTVIDQAIASLTVANFGQQKNRGVLANKNTIRILIKELLALLKKRNTNGVNINWI